MRRILSAGLAVATAVALTLLAIPPVSAQGPALIPDETLGGTALIAGNEEKTYPTVTQTGSFLDLDTYKYTVEITIPIAPDTDITDVRLFLSHTIYPSDPTHSDSSCIYQRSSGGKTCDSHGEFPVIASAKYTKKRAIVTFTITAPSGFWEIELWIIKDNEDWRFPAIYGGADCLGCY